MMFYPLKSIYIIQVLVRTALSLDFSANNDDAPVSISSMSGFLDQRRCARDCFGGDTTDRVASMLGCVVWPPLNNCYCRDYLQPTVRTYLSTCAKGHCTIGNGESEVATALSYYNAYCKANAPTASLPSLPSDNPAKTTDRTQSFVSEARPRATSSSAASSRSGVSASSSRGLSPTMTQEPGSPSATSGTVPNSERTGSSGLSASDKIALGTGLSVPILGIVVTIVICRMQRSWFRLSRKDAL